MMTCKIYPFALTKSLYVDFLLRLFEKTVDDVNLITIKSYKMYVNWSFIVTN